MNYTKHFECGCKVVVVGELTNAKIHYCPKHKAAPDMYYALQCLITSYESHCPEAKEESEAIKIGKVALSKAGGRQE